MLWHDLHSVIHVSTVWPQQDEETLKTRRRLVSTVAIKASKKKAADLFFMARPYSRVLVSAVSTGISTGLLRMLFKFKSKSYALFWVFLQSVLEGCYFCTFCWVFFECNISTPNLFGCFMNATCKSIKMNRILYIIQDLGK